MDRRMTRLLAAVVLPLLVLCIVSANTPRFAWRETDDVEELLEIPAFDAATERYEAQFENVVWYDPIRYTGFFPHMGEVLCVPYLAYDLEDVQTVNSSNWLFSVGFLLWDPVTEAETSAPALMCRDAVFKLNVEGLNTSVGMGARGAHVEEYGLWYDPTYVEFTMIKEKAPAAEPVTLETYAGTIDSDVDANTERRLPILARFTLYHRGLLPSEELPMSIGTSGATFISNVRHVPEKIA